jgi:hypothetical protein
LSKLHKDNTVLRGAYNRRRKSMDKDYPERPECDFSKPLDQRAREAEAYQLELFPEEAEEREKQKLRQLLRKLYE